MKMRFFACSAAVVLLSACGGNKVSDQPAADSTAVAVDTLNQSAKAPEKEGIFYKNNRFHFSVAVPADFVAQPDPENGDGRTFKRGNSTIIAYAGYSESFDEVLAFGGSATDTYNAHKDNWAVWSGVDNGAVYYKKTIFKDGVAYSLYFQYPESEKTEFDDIIKSVVNSWQIAVVKE